MDIGKTLDERGSSYGAFENGAEISQQLKRLLKTQELPTLQAEALDMILSKISRVINGQIDHIDSWHDIAGYATLVVSQLKKEKEDV